MSIAKFYGRGASRYLELIKAFPLRPLQAESDLDAALQIIERLIDQKKLKRAESDYLAVISDLVVAYEEKHYPDPILPDKDMLKYLIETREVSRTSVAKGAAIAKSTISELLSGKRKLNRNQIGKLARYFHVDPGVFAFGE